ncbi:MAG: DNA polymerase domain-containing protein [Thermoplasmata archaeon]
MEKEKVRIINGSYRSINDGVMIELYGKTEKGESITLLYQGFRPYFYLVEPPFDLLDEFKKDEEIRGFEDEELWVEGEIKDCKKVICTYPWKVPKYRNKARKYCKVLAADIPFIQRFIYDMDLGASVTSLGDYVDLERYTTDKIMKVEKFEGCETIKPPLKYLSFDIENSIENETIHTICGVIEEKRGFDSDEEKERGRKEFKLSGSEKDILKEFQGIVNEEDPDIITGYNINGYDIPVILKRLKKLGMGELKIGRDDSEVKDIGNRIWGVNGRVIADAWWSVRTELNLKRETLNHVSEELLGEHKDDVDPLKIDEEWEDNPDKVMEYCLKDADLALKILYELESIDKAMDMATVSKLPLDEGLNGRTSTLIDSILIREADKEGVGVPLTHHRKKTGKIKGGYVHSIEPGLYHWVSVLDFKSMYPSIIIENNICFTTLSKSGDIESPNGVKYLSPEEKEGLLPGLLRKLMDERDEVKQKMKESEGDKKDYYQGLQSAIKILMNSFYGVFASTFYRFTDPRIGESITAFARKNIKKLIENLESEGFQVIYSDTDSVFFQNTEDDLDSVLEQSKKIADNYTQGDMVLEFEKVLDPFFSHGRKKRYVGKVIWPEEGMLVRGYELRRSDSFEAQNEALEDVFDRILNDDIDGAVEVAKSWIKRTREGDIPPKKLIISRSCKKFSRYVNPDSMPNVQAARKMEKKGYRFTPGMKVSWVVIDGENTPQEVEPWLPDSELEGEPDREYYARRIAKTISRVTDVFGWNQESLMYGNKQSNLFSSDFENDDKNERGPERTDENVTLEDFM